MSPDNKTPDTVSDSGRVIVTAPVSRHRFQKKNGEYMDFEELYLSRSIQDYYIKFCESKVTRTEIEEYLAKKGDLIPTITVEVEFMEGEWDRCPGDPEMQSRVGEYVIILKLLSH